VTIGAAIDAPLNDKQQIHDYVLIDCQLTMQVDGVQGHSDSNWMLQSLFGVGHWAESWIKNLCQCDPLFLNHLSEQTPAYIHYICVLRLAWTKDDTAPAITEQARLIRQRRQKALLKALYHPYPSGLLSVLNKLEQRPLSKGDYRRLLVLLEQPASRAFLAHADQLKSYHLKWLEDFPHTVFRWQVLNSISQASDYQQLRYMVEAIPLLPDGIMTPARYRSLKQLKTFSQLRHWFQRQLLKLEFPPAPWEGNSEIHPIKTMKELKRTAQQFHNCIFEYGRGVLSGHRYYYMSDIGPAVIALVNDPLISWHIDEINGVDNTPVDDETNTWITDHFTNANLHTHPISADDSLGDEAWESVCDELFY
jgi:hypothetical protein